MDIETDIRIQGKPIIVGILGIHNTISKEDMHEKVLHPLMSALGRLPEKLILPSEGTSSAYISLWAERNHIDTQCVEADWRKFQRKAGILRDARILKECTVLVTFVGAKSRTNEQTAIRQLKKGKQVFLIEPNPIELCEIVLE